MWGEGVGEEGVGVRMWRCGGEDVGVRMLGMRVWG